MEIAVPSGKLMKRFEVSAVRGIRGDSVVKPSFTRRELVSGAVAGAGLAAAVASTPIVGVARAQPAQKTFVLVHGAWVGGWYWRRVADLLEKQGHKVFSPTLTGLGERSHLLSKEIDLDTHVTDIVNVVKWENLSGICFVVHSYAGFPGSGALEQIGDRVSSIVWLDAFKPENGQKAIDFTIGPLRKLFLNAKETGEPGVSLPAGVNLSVFVNQKDAAYFRSKLTLQPVGSYLQPIKLSGVRDKVSKKTYIRLPKFPNPAFDKALAECKADKSWSTLENTTSGHAVMMDEPEWLAGVLVQAA
jgi:Alpha/beta hydrolase family